jgi:hypothetical protein
MDSANMIKQYQRMKKCGFVNTNVECSAVKVPGGHLICCYVKMALFPRERDTCCVSLHDDILGHGVSCLASLREISACLSLHDDLYVMVSAV